MIIAVSEDPRMSRCLIADDPTRIAPNPLTVNDPTFKGVAGLTVNAAKISVMPKTTK